QSSVHAAVPDLLPRCGAQLRHSRQFDHEERAARVRGSISQRQSWWCRGQTLAEVAITLPLLTLLLVGTLQVGWTFYQDHVLTKVAREAANMISRQVTLTETGTVIHDNTTPYAGGSFDNNAKLILSVVQLGTAGANNNLPIIMERYIVG